MECEPVINEVVGRINYSSFESGSHRTSMKIKISVQTLKALCDLITGKPYRSGPQLIAFFNQFGWSDVYGQVLFSSRWKYAEEKLNTLNNSDHIVKCIEQAVDPRNFLGTNEDSEQIVQDINHYLQY